MELSENAPSPPAENRNADERSTLLDMLDFYRTVLVRKTFGLTDEQFHSTPLVSTLSLARLLAHMAFVEDHWFEASFAGRDQVEPWASADFESDPDWEMSWSAGRDHRELVELLQTSVERSRSTVGASPDLSALAAATGDQQVSLRWILVHMVEEYARHVGHADMIRETIDGQTGD